MLKRCKWVNPNNPKYIKYHDEEWGKPVKDDRLLFEMLCLEIFMAGLSWECVLNKREAFKTAFDNFEVDKVVNYKEEKIEELMQNKAIINHRLKIEACINNAKVFKKIQVEFGSFACYLWSFVDNQIIYEKGQVSNAYSDKLTSDLKRRGAKFIGTKTIYAYMQAVGLIYSHEDCFLEKHDA